MDYHQLEEDLLAIRGQLGVYFKDSHYVVLQGDGDWHVCDEVTRIWLGLSKFGIDIDTDIYSYTKHIGYTQAGYTLIS
jgi:hypothetical protein